MARLALPVLLAVAVLATLSPPAQGVDFVFQPGPTYTSVNSSLDFYSFEGTLRSTIGGDQLYVVFEPHVPMDWFSQWCFDGSCYFASGPITLRGGDTYPIQFDFMMPPGEVDRGWVDIRIRRVSDPTTWEEVTYAIGHGLTLPVSSFAYTASHGFEQGNPGQTFEIDSVIRSYNAFDDELICNMQPVVPAGWMTQFCQTSTGICYPQTATVPFPANITDHLRVDFFTNATPGVGTVRMKLQSAANPAIYRVLNFRVRTGSIPADAPEAAAAPLLVRATPNPLRESTEIRVMLSRPSSLALSILDATGRVVLSRTTAPLPAGSHPLKWDGRDASGRALPEGIYFYRVEGTGVRATGKLAIER